jgi:signal transduction histidine kinase
MKMPNPAHWSIRWQIAALLIATQVLAHVVTAIAINLAAARSGGEAELVLNLSEPMLTALRMTDSVDVPDATGRFAALTTIDDRFHMTDRAPMSAAETKRGANDALQRALVQSLPALWQNRIVIQAIDGGAASFDSFTVAARLWDENWLVFTPRGNTLVENVPKLIAFLGLLFFALPLMLLSVWSGVVLVAPITALAKGAEQFAQDMSSPPLVEDGPVEVRMAKHAFNQMRLRIQKLLSDRSQTLASIGHDMRTPLTRLRLRLEMLELEPDTAALAIEDDIARLERMIDDALDFLRAENRPLVLAQVDLAVMAKTVADDYADRGHAIAYQGPPRLVFRCDADLIRRILDNVVGNAAKFAENVQVILMVDPMGAATIEVRDDGPGIPLDHRDKVLQPFTRIEAVRAGTAQNAEGFGLGLAIARDLTERHGGTLTLAENQQSGLLVTISLPKRYAGEDGMAANAGSDDF